MKRFGCSHRGSLLPFRGHKIFITPLAISYRHTMYPLVSAWETAGFNVTLKSKKMGTFCAWMGYKSISIWWPRKESMLEGMGGGLGGPDKPRVADRHKQMETNNSTLWCWRPLGRRETAWSGIAEKCQAKHTSTEARQGCQWVLIQHAWCFSNEDMLYTVEKMQGCKQVWQRHGQSTRELDLRWKSEMKAETNRRDDSGGQGKRLWRRSALYKSLFY